MAFSDAELYFEAQGQGFPLILLHGNGESGEYFRNQKAVFAESYRVISVDTRGHGRSPRGVAPFTISQFADDLKAFMDAHGIEKAHILGFSDGGNIALLFALRYPRYVEKLILNGANLNTSGVKFGTQAEIVVGHALVSLISLFDRKALPKKEMLSLMIGQPNIEPKELAALTAPTLVIVGDGDMIKDAHSRLIAASLPNGVFKRITGSHFIAAENSERFNAEVLEFLKP